MPQSPENRRETNVRARPRRQVTIRDAVRWHDGMPLAPQHFQESFRRAERVLDYHLGLLAPHHYGVASLDIDARELASRVLSVLVEAVLPDHFIVSTPSRVDVTLDPAELLRKAASAGRRGRIQIFDVYLAVPNEHDGQAAAGDAPRYSMPANGDQVTDDTTGEGSLEVHRLVPNVQIVVDVEPPPDSAWIRLAQLRLDGEAFQRTDYVPPLLAVTPGTPLFALCSRVVETIRSLSNRLGERIGVLSENTDGALIAETRRQLYHLTAALPPFEAMLTTGRSHPYPLYVGLAAILGQLAPLARLPVPPPPPAYQHDDLQAVFSEMELRVQRAIREGIQQSFKPHPFTIDAEGFRLDFVSDWADQVVLVAVRMQRDGDLQDVEKWMEGAKIGPASSKLKLLESRSNGVDRERVPRVDDLVPTNDEVLFVLKNLKDFFRNDVPLLIFNPTKESQEIQPSEMVLYVKESQEGI